MSMYSSTTSSLSSSEEDIYRMAGGMNGESNFKPSSSNFSRNYSKGDSNKQKKTKDYYTPPKSKINENYKKDRDPKKGERPPPHRQGYSSFKHSSSEIGDVGSRLLREQEDKAVDYYTNKRKQKEYVPPKDEPPVYPEQPPKKVAIQKKGNICDFGIYIIIGYISGVFLMLIWYAFHRKQARTDLNARWVFIVFGGLLLLLPCVNHASRCVMVLVVCSIGKSKGFILSMHLALLLSITGPLMNIIRNVEIMCHSVACEQTLLKNALTPMHEIMGEPVHAVEQAVYICIRQVHYILENLDYVLQDLAQPITELHENIKRCYYWLRNQQHFFETQMGSPHERCIGAGSICVRECHSKFGANNKACNIEAHFEWFCENINGLPSFFNSNLDQQQQLTDVIFNRTLKYFDKMRSIFEVSITFDHSEQCEEGHQTFDTNLDMVMDTYIHKQMRSFFILLSCVYLVFAIVVIKCILSSVYFHLNSLSNTFFNNFYINKEFEDVSLLEQKNFGYSVLPLHSIEVYSCVQFGSFRILPCEQWLVRKAVLLMIYSTLQVFIICFVDYSLYWFLANMECHAHNLAELQPPEYTKIVVTNGGMIGKIVQDLVRAFEPLCKNLVGDVERCLPIPLPLRYARYWAILIVCLLSWFLIILVPFCQRLAHRVMASFYPANAEKRAAYLHQRLMTNRDLRIKRYRRRARSSYLYAYDSWLCQMLIKYLAVLYWITCGLCGTYKGRYCVVCKIKLTKVDYFDCETKDCPGVYCQRCFLDANCRCILCSHKSAYGDYSDLSEFGDSSDDPEGVPYRPKNVQCLAQSATSFETESRQKNAKHL